MVKGEEITTRFLLNITGLPRSKEARETAEAI
jgi:hypothetical protein